MFFFGPTLSPYPCYNFVLDQLPLQWMLFAVRAEPKSLHPRKPKGQSVSKGAVFKRSNAERSEAEGRYILVMQCFRVGYRGICHASLVFSVYIQTFRRVYIRRRYNSTVSHEKHCITTLSHSEIFGKLTEIFGRARNLGEFPKKTSETLQTRLRRA